MARLQNRSVIRFTAWILNGNAVKEGKDSYLEQTTQYRRVFTRKQLFKFFKNEYLTN